MTGSTLLAVPLPFVTAALALALALRMIFGGFGKRASGHLFAALFFVLAAQAALVGLRFGYRIDGLIGLQRVLPLLTAPLTYLGFRVLAEPPLGRRGIALHLSAAFGLVALAMRWPGPVDILIGLSFVSYIVLSARLLAQGPAAFEALALSAVGALRRWLLAAVLLLGFIALMDLAIALDFATAAGTRAPALIGLGSLVLIPALVAAALLWPAAAVAPSTPPSRPAAALVERIEALLETTGLYRDPDLSLGRLARRLGQPARDVSEAVNRVKGCNVSQLVNDHRIRAAADALARSTEPVAELMLGVGFRSRSNFYREFRRVHGLSPADFRRAERAQAQPSSSAGSSSAGSSGPAATTAARPCAGGSSRST